MATSGLDTLENGKRRAEIDFQCQVGYDVVGYGVVG